MDSLRDTEYTCYYHIREPGLPPRFSRDTQIEISIWAANVGIMLIVLLV